MNSRVVRWTVSAAAMWLLLAFVVGLLFPPFWANVMNHRVLPVVPKEAVQVLDAVGGPFFDLAQGPRASWRVKWQAHVELASDLNKSTAEAQKRPGWLPTDVMWGSFQALLFRFTPVAVLLVLALALLFSVLSRIHLPSLGGAAAVNGTVAPATGAGLLGGLTGLTGLATAVVILAVAGLLFSRFVTVGGAGTPVWERVLNSQVPCEVGPVPEFEVKATTVVTFTGQVKDLLLPVRAAQACVGAGQWTSVDSQRELLTALFALEDTVDISPDVQAVLAGGGKIQFWDEISVWIYAYAEAYERPTTSAQFHVNALVFEGWFRQAEAIYLAHAGGTISKPELERAIDMAAASFTRSKALAEEQAAGLLLYTPEPNDLQRLNLTVVNAGRLLEALQKSK